MMRSLTQREWQVVELMRRRLTIRAIARELGVAEGTASTYVHDILLKLDRLIDDQGDAVPWASGDRAVIAVEVGPVRAPKAGSR